MNNGSVARQETATVGAEATPEMARVVAAAARRVYEAWPASSTDQRREILAEVCTPDVEYVNPLKRARGIQEFAETISELAGALPGHLPVRTSGVDAHHDWVRYEWALRDRSGQAVLGGIEIVRFTPEARLASIVSFFGQPPRITYTYQV
ncbi:SnoaL-like domain-containing protein [Frankia sp. EI5c]|uniref:nuclear transport factor 2 family protein n=1 Tax=Frankia sp. EI5c TaxID=683316 RepID=UPI0007C3C24B|nr:nuclear transport factor 2 family protein [Frankia sp. EI5c]OAA18428.1 SnoaL-like domain-containing protein [Frankia sp. EI5c]